MTLNRLDTKPRPYALYAFLWALILSAFVVLPIMIYDKGYFLYYGDFNVQEIPFYRLAHDSILSGNMGWSHLTDLGSNFIGSYSFYLLGSPFFWLTLPLPSAWVPYAMGPLLMLKLAFCSLTAYIYLRRYVRDRKYAVIGGVLYAFSGFSVYNIFFFHFHEAMIVFPLLLAAMDEFHAAKRRGVVAVAVFACAVVNYYFFFGQVVFTAIYYVVKLISKSYRFKLWDLIYLALECVLGLGMSMFLLLPSLSAIVGNYRVNDFVNGWSTLIYSKTQRYLQIFISFFFPADVPAKNNFTPSAGGKWSSVAAYLPMFSMTFVIGYLRVKKGGFFRRMLLILLLMAFVPVLNSLFQYLNSSYYARWFYMITLLTALVTVQSLEDLGEINFKKGFIPTAAITLAVALLIGLIPKKETDDAKREVWSIGLEESVKHYWLFVGMAVGGLVLTWLLWRFYKKKPRYFYRAAALCLSIFVILYSELYLWAGKIYTDRSDEFMINYALNFGEDVTLEDIGEVRSDFYDTSDNLGMFWQVPTIQAFHSIVPGSVMNFYNFSGINRDVGSRPAVEFYGLRTLLSVKYLFVEATEENDRDECAHLMPGYQYIDTENGFYVYENLNYIPMGFTYDSYLTEEEYLDLINSVKHLALLKALVLTQDQMKKYADITGYTDGMYLNLNFTHNTNEPQNKAHPEYEGFDSITASFDYSENSYIADANRLKENTCSAFSYDNEGFTAQFTNKGDDNLLFFSVPYDSGWTAYVNGEETDIEQVNIGFMAVRVPGHRTSDIVFKYHTPQLREGAIISGAAAAVFLFYLFSNKGFRAQRKRRRFYRIKQDHHENTEIKNQGGNHELR